MRPAVTAREAIGLAMADEQAPEPQLEPRLELRPRRPRPIRTAGEYVAVVRRLYPEPCRHCGGRSPYQEDCYVCRRSGIELRPVADGRLIAPLWRTPAIPPREWGEGGRGREWLAYWAATQPRPERIGSCYNDEPADAARAWSLGIPAERYPLGKAHLLPARGWRGGRRRILAACRLARRRAVEVPTCLRTADLRRLGRLSGAFLRAAGPILAVGRAVDWAEMARLHGQWLAVQAHRAHLQDARVPAAEWLSWLSAGAEGRRWIERRHAERARAAHAKRRAEQWGRAAAARREREGTPAEELPWRTVERYADSAILWRARSHAAARTVWSLTAPAAACRSWDARPTPEEVVEALRHLCAARRVDLLAALRSRVSELRAAWALPIAAAAEREHRAAEAARAAAIEAGLARRRARRAEDGALLGWRGWRLNYIRAYPDESQSEAVLVSPHRPVRWEGPELVAADVTSGGEIRGPAILDGEPRGRLDGGDRHAAGIHATWDPRRHETAGTYDPRTMDVLGRVRGYGAYAAGPEGWRAERVVIDRLLVPARYIRAAAALATRYQCRVRVVRWDGGD